MNIGGDQGQDDYGLPPVDIEIPDDARELALDVQAYRRELRMRRRQRFFRRLREPLMTDGMVLPLLACCLALTLVAGTILTVFTGAQGTFDPTQRLSASPGPHSPAPGQVGGPLPDTVVEMSGVITAVRALPKPFVLALAPGGCHCLSALSVLRSHVSAAGARMYVVATRGVQAVPSAKEISLPSGYAGQDSRGGLAEAYHPAGLTALFVRADGTVVSIVRGGRPAAFDQGLQAMSSSPGTGPAGTAPARN